MDHTIIISCRIDKLSSSYIPTLATLNQQLKSPTHVHCGLGFDRPHTYAPFCTSPCPHAPFSDDTSRMILTSVVLLSLVSPSIAAVCVGEGDKPQTLLDWWRDDVVQGTRGFHVTPTDISRPAGGSVSCMAKGFRSNTELLDPVVRSTTWIADFYQESHMPCKILSLMDVPDDALEFAGNKNTTEKATGNRRRHLLADDSCAVSRPSLDSCSYPGEAHGQEHWGGVSFKISQVNYNHTTPDVFKYSDVAYEPGATGVKNELQHVWAHSPVYGGDRKVCELAESSTTSLYKSGVVLKNSPLPYDMKYMVYMFASDTEREAALNDARNVGLKYARAMKGENGCDAEIVYEFFPKPGGGLMVELSQIAKCTSYEEESSECSSKRHAITDTTSAYIADDSVIVQVKKSTLRSAQYLPVRADCDNDMTTTVKMSSQFICAKTGERINITSITMSRTKPGDKVTSEISRDPANPTTFQVDPNNPSTCYWDPSCRGGNQHDVDIRLDADAASAPESCGSFFWDPLIYSVPGDGMAASVAASSAPTSQAPDVASRRGLLPGLVMTALSFLL